MESIIRIMVQSIRHALLVVALCSTTTYAEDVQLANSLPELGDTSSAIISPAAEEQLGQLFLKEIRTQLPLESDPILKYYTRLHLLRVAEHSDLKTVKLYPVLVKSKVLNAFAAPGGIIGTHVGLFLYAEDVHEYSSVIAHELAHLSQRHYARRIEKEKGIFIGRIASILASAAIMASGHQDAGSAVLFGSQAIAQNQYMTYSRSAEHEADRVGFNTLVRAGFDPGGMSRMFENMQQAFRFDQDPPIFLRTHPVSEARISDARDQLRDLPQKSYEQSIEYQLMRARAKVLLAETPATVYAEANGSSVETVIDRYFRGLAATRTGNYEQALEDLSIVMEALPSSILVQASYAEALTLADQANEAVKLLSVLLEINPDNAPLSMLYASALNAQSRHSKAANVLRKQSREHPDDIDVWYELAETSGLADQIADVHRARAEWFVLRGDYSSAIRHFKLAKDLVDENSATEIRLDQRLQDVRDEAEDTG